MNAQFIVTVEGEWHSNGKPVTARIMERELREAAKDCFAHLATRVTVKSAPAQPKDDTAPEQSDTTMEKANA